MPEAFGDDLDRRAGLEEQGGVGVAEGLRRPDVVQFAGMTVMMPLMFESSAFAPLDTMPGWMQALANINPVSHATDALRGAVLGAVTAGDMASALVAATAMRVAVFATPTRRR